MSKCVIKDIFFSWIRANFGCLALIDSWDRLEWKGVGETTLPQQNVVLFCFFLIFKNQVLKNNKPQMESYAADYSQPGLNCCFNPS